MSNVDRRRIGEVHQSITIEKIGFTMSMMNKSMIATAVVGGSYSRIVMEKELSSTYRRMHRGW